MTIHRLFFLVALLFTLGQVRGQEFVTWTILSDVHFQPVYEEDLGYEIDSASFGKLVLPFDGKDISVSGFVIPLDALGTSYALSRNPNASCFFCGGAGPETVIQLNLKPSAYKRYEMDAVMKFKGKLRLNTKNADQFTYVLEAAEPDS
jgi:hypothetical protein